MRRCRGEEEEEGEGEGKGKEEAVYVGEDAKSTFL